MAASRNRCALAATILAIAALPVVTAAAEPVPLPSIDGTVSLLLRGPTRPPNSSIDISLGDLDVRDVDRLPSLGSTRVLVAASDAEAAAARLADLDPGASVTVDPVVHIADTTPNDTYWSYQWGARAVRAPAAWDRTTGSSAVTIAVVDTGVNPVPDLGSRLLPGHDFVNGDSDAADDHGGRHGTSVATVAAGAGNDAAGVAGVCWQCKVLPVKVMDSTGAGYMSDVALGVDWAVDHGAQVVNLSLGGAGASVALQDAMGYATAHDVVVVGAAGNDGTTNIGYPAGYPSVIAVAGTDQDGSVDPASTRGASWVDVAAPWCNPATNDLGAYNFCGTSSATPIVSGVAGLLRSAAPGDSATQIRAALEGSTGPLAVPGAVAHGLVDAAASLDALAVASGATASPTPSPSPQSADTTPPSASISTPQSPVTGIVSTTVTAVDDRSLATVTLTANGQVLGTQSVSGTHATATFSWASSDVADGPVELAAQVSDGAGNQARSDAVGTIVDNRPPTVSVAAPVGTVRGAFVVQTRASDAAGIKLILLAAGGRWVGIVPGGGPARVMVTPRSNGRIAVAAIAVDNVGHLGLSNLAEVTAKGVRVAVTRHR